MGNEHEPPAWLVDVMRNYTHAPRKAAQAVIDEAVMRGSVVYENAGPMKRTPAGWITPMQRKVSIPLGRVE